MYFSSERLNRHRLKRAKHEYRSRSRSKTPVHSRTRRASRNASRNPSSHYHSESHHSSRRARRTRHKRRHYRSFSTASRSRSKPVSTVLTFYTLSLFSFRVEMDDRKRSLFYFLSFFCLEGAAFLLGWVVFHTCHAC